MDAGAHPPSGEHPERAPISNDSAASHQRAHGLPACDAVVCGCRQSCCIHPATYAMPQWVQCAAPRARGPRRRTPGRRASGATPSHHATAHPEPPPSPPACAPAALGSNKSSSDDALAMRPRASAETTLPSAAESTITDGMPRTGVRSLREEGAWGQRRGEGGVSSELTTADARGCRVTDCRSTFHCEPHSGVWTSSSKPALALTARSRGQHTHRRT